MTLMKLVIDAASFASVKHHGQLRSGTELPYIVHPLEVARILSDHGHTSPWLLAAAILHDVLEDTDATPEELRYRFSREVASVVQEVTDDPALTKKENRMAKLAAAPLMSPMAKAVKIADAISNTNGTNDECPAGWSTSLKLAFLKTCEQMVTACRTIPEGAAPAWASSGIHSSWEGELEALARQFDRDVRHARERLTRGKQA